MATAARSVSGASMSISNSSWTFFCPSLSPDVLSFPLVAPALCLQNPLSAKGFEQPHLSGADIHSKHHLTDSIPQLLSLVAITATGVSSLYQCPLLACPRVSEHCPGTDSCEEDSECLTSASSKLRIVLGMFLCSSQVWRIGMSLLLRL